MKKNGKTPDPDFESFIATVCEGRPPGRVHFTELYFDEAAKHGLCDYFSIAKPGYSFEDPEYRPARDAALAKKLGYDLVRIHLPDSEFRMNVQSSASDPTAATRQTGQGYTVHEHAGPIQNWKDLENYPWPDISRLDTRPLEWAEANLPEGMKAYDLAAQFFECSTWLMGYESLFLNMYDEPEIIDVLLERISQVYFDYIRLLCDFECIGVIWAADDMGFKTQTLVSPNWLRENVLPLHKKAAAIAHEKGKRYFLHSCGKVDELMEDLIEDVGIDAKHSFEDSVTPVTDFSEQYGRRIGVLGGIDIDFLARATPEEVRKRTRRTLEHCMPGGRYALGSGNSITGYVPLENYLAMWEEGLRFNDVIKFNR